jgi:hypothetical protein
MAAFALFYSCKYRAALSIFQAELVELELSVSDSWKYLRCQCLLMIAACHHHLYMESNELQSASGEIKACLDLISLLTPNPVDLNVAFDQISSQCLPPNLLELIRSHLELLFRMRFSFSIALSAQPLLNVNRVKFAVVPYRWPLGADFLFEVQLNYPFDILCDFFDCSVYIERSNFDSQSRKQKNVTFGNYSELSDEADSSSNRVFVFPQEISCILPGVILHPGLNQIILPHRPKFCSSFSNIGAQDSSSKEIHTVLQEFFDNYSQLEPFYLASNDCFSVADCSLRLSLSYFKVVRGCVQLEEVQTMRNPSLKKSSLRLPIVESIPCDPVAFRDLLSVKQLSEAPRLVISISTPSVVDRVVGSANPLYIVTTMRSTSNLLCNSGIFFHVNLYLRPNLKLFSSNVFAVLGSKDTCSACLQSCSRSCFSLCDRVPCCNVRHLSIELHSKSGFLSQNSSDDYLAGE